MNGVTHIVILIVIILVILIAFVIAFFAYKKQANRCQKKENTYEGDSPEYNTLALWVMCISICLAVWVIGGVLTHIWAENFFKDESGGNEKALFGDSFGAVNALVSSFAFAGMIVSFFLQKQELKLQRKELAAQRDEFKQQNATLKLQRFENTFFNKMELHQQIVNDLKMSDERYLSDSNIYERSTHIVGRELFRFAFEKVSTDKGRGVKSVLAEYGMKGYEKSEIPPYFDHYFLHLYSMIKFVDTSCALNEKEKYKYISFIRSTLSRYELVWIYYNGLSKYANTKLKPLIEKYALLDNLRREMLPLSHGSKKFMEKFNVTKDDVLKNGFTGTDYEFLLTRSKNNKDKYHYSAFYSDYSINGKFGSMEAIKQISEWEEFWEKKGVIL